MDDDYPECGEQLEDGDFFYAGTYGCCKHCYDAHHFGDGEST